MAIGPFWFSMEHHWAALTPFWLSADNLFSENELAICHSANFDSINNDNNNNTCNWFLYSAVLVWDTTQSTLQCIITPSHWMQYQSCTHSAPSHSLGSILARCHFRGAHISWSCVCSSMHICHIKRQIMFASYRVPIYIIRGFTSYPLAPKSSKCSILSFTRI